MEEQFIHLPIRAEMELHPEALKLFDDDRLPPRQKRSIGQRPRRSGA
jgi:hypothetical protein